VKRSEVKKTAYKHLESGESAAAFFSMLILVEASLRRIATSLERIEDRMDLEADEAPPV
jgi:hypothetical protein